MASRREQVLQALEQLVTGALPHARFLRNRDKPHRPDPGGIVVMRDGDPGPPVAEDLSPHVCHYEHPVEFELAGPEGAPPASVDELWAQIGEAVRADRTLGGLCDHLRALPLASDEAQAPGTDGLPWAQGVLVAHYALPG